MYLFVLGIMFGYSNGNALIPKEHFNSQLLASCLDNLIDSFEETSFIYAVDLDLELQKPVIRFDWRREKLVWFKFAKSEVIVIQLNGEELKATLETLFQNSLFNPRSYVVIITSKVTSVLFRIASEFFINRLLVVEEESELVQRIYTYRPYQYESVNTPSIDFFRWGTCKGGGLVRSRRLLRDGLPIRWSNTTILALANIVPPYSICPTCTNNKGIEIETFNAIAQHLQLRVNYTRDSFDYWGSKQNGSYSHIYGQLQRREGDMTIGVFHSKFEEHLDFDMSFTYMEDGTRWLVPKARIIPYWKRLSLIFTKEVYLSTLFSLLVVMVVCHILYDTSYTTSLVMLYQILLESSLKRMPLTFRTVIIFWTCCCLILSTMFKSKLIDIMSKDSFEHQINSLADIVASKLRIVVDDDIAKFYDYYTNSDEEYIRKNYEFCPYPRFCINRTAFDQDCVTVDFQRSNEFFLPQLLDSEGDVLLHLFKTPIFPVHIHLFFARGYPIFPQIDQLLMRMRSNGVIDHLYENAGHNARIAMSKKSTFKAEVLGLEQMQVAFFMWSVGILTSLAVFVVEFIAGVVSFRCRIERVSYGEE